MKHVALPQDLQAAVETRPVVAEAGGEVVVEVDRVVDARRPEGVALQVQRLGSRRSSRRGRSRQRRTCWPGGGGPAPRRSATGAEDVVRRFVEACRRTRTIRPATTTIEWLCADALVDAERRIRSPHRPSGVLARPEGRAAGRIPA